jgi:endonuclease/exonuclease/phosphatase family metal-dependent hydrolase
MKNIRIGSFNVFNLVRPGVGYYSTKPYSSAEFSDKTMWIGRQLDDMEAEIVGFQEVFHQDALRTALERSARFAGVEPIVFATNEAQQPARTPAVALATTLELEGAPESIADFPSDSLLSVPTKPDDAALVAIPVTQFSRPVLKARVRLSDSVIATVFVAHLKSKRPTLLDSEVSKEPIHRTLGTARALIRRAAEAAALRSLVIAETKDGAAPVIVIGDVNDGTLAVTTQMIAGEQPFFRLKADLKAPHRDVLLYTAQQLQAGESTRDTYFTHIFNGSYEALDHIMVSEEFYRRNPSRVGEVDYVRVFNDHLIDEMQSFDDIPRTRSDHGQVVVKIRLNEPGGAEIA